MALSPLHAATGSFPRALSPTLLWTGGCLDISYRGKVVHSHLCTYLVLGSEKTLLVDTGNPSNWREVERDVEGFLGGRPLDYVFCTHVELPHAGLLAQWLDKYPGAVALGRLTDYELYYPAHADRMRNVEPGQSVDLGDRRIVFLPAIWRDLKETLWAFDTTERTLFVSDAFAYLHYHHEGQCDRLASEQPLPDVDMIQFFNERALFWTQHTDASRSFADIDEMLSMLQPRAIATAHGGVLDITEGMLPLVKSGMMTRIQGGTGL